MGDDVEIVGYRIAEPLTHLLIGFVKECFHRFEEPSEVTMEVVVRHLPVHDAPETLGRIQMRRIGR